MLAAAVNGGGVGSTANAAGAHGGAGGFGTAIERQRDPIWPRAVRWTGTGIVCAWAAFWTWFAFNVALTEGGQSWLYGGGASVIALGLAGVLMRWPRAGGVVAVLLGSASMVVLTYPNVWMMMGLPMVLGGLLAAAGGWMARKRG